MVEFRLRSVAQLILTLRERELARFPITAVLTTIGRDAGSDIVIDNAGISRLHAKVEVAEDIFVLRDCDSQNGITLNGEPCKEGHLVHGDVIGLNKFLLRFSNETLEVPDDLQTNSEKPVATRPKEIQQTLLLDEGSAQTFADIAKLQIAKQRAALRLRGGESLGPPSEVLPAAPAPLSWEEPESNDKGKWAVFAGGMLVGGAIIAALLSNYL